MKELFTKKIYYKKFNHRLAIACRKNNREIKKPTPEVIEYLMNTKFGKEWRGITSSSYEGPYTWNRRASKNLYTVFFKDPRAFDYLEKIIGRDSFEEYEKPMDEQHTQMLEKEKVLTRKILFHNKYRIALRVPSIRLKGQPGSSTAHVDDMEEWCAENLGPRASSLDLYMIQRWTNSTFYFANPKDAMLFKLVFGEYVKTTERVVLISELEEARKEVAE